MTILLIDNYDSFTFNLAQALESVSSAPLLVKRNDQISFDEIEQLRPSGIVISPGPGNPDNVRDFGISATVLQEHASLSCPILGVCLGHQGIVLNFGGIVEQATRIMHGKSSKIKIVEESRLFAGCQSEFTAMRYHSLIASDVDFPACLKVTARDTEAETIMAVEHRSRYIFGLQFHPESIGTDVGLRILTNFADICQEAGNGIQRYPVHAFKE